MSQGQEHRWRAPVTRVSALAGMSPKQSQERVQRMVKNGYWHYMYKLMPVSRTCVIVSKDPPLEMIPGSF
jgi:hypothetical protein